MKSDDEVNRAEVHHNRLSFEAILQEAHRVRILLREEKELIKNFFGRQNLKRCNFYDWLVEWAQIGGKFQPIEIQVANDLQSAYETPDIVERAENK